MSDAEQVQAYEQASRNFRLTFNTPAGHNVMIYLANFCRAAETCVAMPHARAPIDLNRTLILEGRREVWLEIQKFLNLTPEQLFSLSTGRSYLPGEKADGGSPGNGNDDAD